MKIKLLFLTLFLTSVAVFLVHFFIVGKAVYGDGRYYYSYLPAFLIQHSLNLSDAFKHTNIPNWVITPIGLPGSKYSIGPALFWAPPYLLIYSLSYAFHSANQYNTYYQIPIGISVISLGIIGLFFLWKSLKLFFTENTATLSIITCFFATNLLFYGAIDVLNSHIITFFLSSILLFVWLKKPTVSNALIQGFLIGLLMLVRFQEAIFLILPLSTMLLQKKKIVFLAFLTTLISFFPQLFLWHALWGTWTQSPYLHYETFNLFYPHVWGVLFNHDSGLFLWTPITLLASIGLILFAKKFIRIGLPLLLVFLLEIYVVASWSTWWQGASYSGRMFVSSLPLLTVGIAYLFEQKIFQKLKYFLAVFLTLMNCLLIVYFLLHK